MIKSMTGYGSSQLSNDYIDISIDIKSVNNKYLDIVLQLPRDFQSFEGELLALIKGAIIRGRLNVSIELELYQDTELIVDYARAEERFNAISELKNNLNISDDITINHILDDDYIIIEQVSDIDKDMVFTYISHGLKLALDQLNLSRLQEGEKLYQDLRKRLKTFEKSLSILKERSPFVVEEYKAKLSKRMNEIIDIDDEFINNRLSSEIVLFAEKSDISEELVRIRSHIDLFYQCLETKKSIGKKMDFICQELLRETNTIGSKSNDIVITNEVINMKTIIDQIREQVQNIE